MNPAKAMQNIAHRFGWDVHRVRYLTEASARLAKICEVDEIDLVLDVGAHRGDWARALRAAGYAGRIISIEPQAAEAAYLETIASGDQNWQIEHAAAGSEDGMAELHVAADTDWSSLLATEGTARTEAVARRSETVAVRRLDSLHLGTAQRIYIKIDVQGFEREVLAGCAGLAGRIAGFQAEVNLEPLYVGQPTVTDLLAEAQTLGLTLAGVENGWIDPTNGRELYIDVIFLRV
jgi:FkbM family methyltransferase